MEEGGRGLGLGQLVLPVGQLALLPLVLPLVGEQLTRGVEHVFAVRPEETIVSLWQKMRKMQKQSSGCGCDYPEQITRLSLSSASDCGWVDCYSRSG